MKRLVVVTALAFVLAAMPSVPQRGIRLRHPQPAPLTTAPPRKSRRQRTKPASPGRPARPPAARGPTMRANRQTQPPKATGLRRGVQQACPTQNRARPRRRQEPRPWRAPAPTAQPLSPHLCRSLAPPAPTAQPLSPQLLRSLPAPPNAACATPEGDHPARARASQVPGVQHCPRPHER